MKKLLAFFRFRVVVMIGLLALPSALAYAAPTATQVFDTTYAVEMEYSCLSGGCHETNSALLTSHKASYMTHVMVKCNACHGTHTTAEVGKPKPNLTGYVAGKGATGYTVGKDRCLVCHTSALTQSKHPKNPGACTSCHTPHTFAR